MVTAVVVGAMKRAASAFLRPSPGAARRSLPQRRVLSSSAVELGIVPAHVGFSRGMAPSADGRLPRTPGTGELALLAEMRALVEECPVDMHAAQISYFAHAHPPDIAELVEGLTALSLQTHFVAMVGGADPASPLDEEAVLAQLLPCLEASVAHGCPTVSSTSFEEWMAPGASRLEGAALAAATEQLAALHLRCYREAGLADSCVQSWHLEFLRPGEFTTYTDAGRAAAVVRATNAALGGEVQEGFFKLLLDSAHCGDSGLSLADNEAVVAQLAERSELGMVHCSAPTTRGCLSTDNGWSAAILSAAARSGQLERVFVEVFDHSDPALAPLRDLGVGHGVDTRGGRSYRQVVIDGLVGVSRQLDDLATRGMLPQA